MPNRLDTRWFAVSGHELVLLAAAVLALFAALGVAELVGAVYGRGSTRVRGSSEYAPTPLRLDVNQADRHELTMLRGIGPKTADAIVRYRQEHGPFGSLDDLRNVRGIGPVTVESIRPHAMCRPPETESETD
jgi:competence protein ComEA